MSEASHAAREGVHVSLPDRGGRAVGPCIQRGTEGLNLTHVRSSRASTAPWLQAQHGMPGYASPRGDETTLSALNITAASPREP